MSGTQPSDNGSIGVNVMIAFPYYFPNTIIIRCNILLVYNKSLWGGRVNNSNMTISSKVLPWDLPDNLTHADQIGFVREPNTYAHYTYSSLRSPRTISHMSIAPAEATLSDSAFPLMGIITERSAN